MNRVLLMSLFAGLLFLSSCLEGDDPIPTEVLSEEIVFVSGERAILTGRILSGSSLNITDHGYELSKQEDFSNPLILSLGEKNIPGRFVVETDDLDILSVYYCRAYADEDGEKIYGNTLTFGTLKPVLVDFEPKVGRPNQIILIRGSNLTADTKVLFDGVNVENFLLNDESFIQFNVPAMTDKVQAEIKVISQGDTLCFEQPFEYVIGLWEEKDAFIQPTVYRSMTYMHNDETLVYGMGVTSTFPGLNPEMWTYDLATQEWEDLVMPGIPTMGTFTNWPIFGGGSLERVRDGDDQLSLLDHVWMYEEGELKQISDIPVLLYNAICHKVDGKYWVYGGEDPERKINRQIQIYDPDTDTWSEGPLIAIMVTSNYPSWHYNGNSYFVMEDGTIFEHNTNTGLVEAVAEFPIPVGRDGLSIVLGDKAFVGLFDKKRNMFEFDHSTYTWKVKIGYPASIDDSNSAVWSYNDEIFYLKNRLEAAPYIWSFNPYKF